jgi:hypothetical protein
VNQLTDQPSARRDPAALRGRVTRYGLFKEREMTRQRQGQERGRADGAVSADRRDAPILCPSAQPDQSGAMVFGVQTVRPDAQSAGPERRVGYLTALQPVTPQVLAVAGTAKATEVLRIAAPCEERACRHFDGAACALAGRVVEMLDPVVNGLPRCLIRPACRWFRQEGKAACLRCPQIVTDMRDLTELQKQVAGLVGEPPPA